ncbi:hypothetical protein [Sediminibacterium sp. C3]|uniref:hypothetical protein n=1 Tax=Sediminibacterium sp. C3 TaxID=1267211 RepID=UPI00047DF822|nr:hypothetical protein [Sediminibacterium sp. C3]
MKKTLLLTLSLSLCSGLLKAQFGSVNQQLVNGSIILSPNSSKSQPNFTNQQNNLFWVLVLAMAVLTKRIF